MGTRKKIGWAHLKMTTQEKQVSNGPLWGRGSDEELKGPSFPQKKEVRDEKEGRGGGKEKKNIYIYYPCP